MKKPQSIFHLVAIWDADSPATNLLFYTCQEALAALPRFHAHGWVEIKEHHPEHGKRAILQYAPDLGLTPTTGYVMPSERWQPGYGAERVLSWLAQYPEPINPGWKR